MAASFFFYDLETSGFDPRRTRIMQFAGQRTDLNLKPIGEPVNLLIKLTPDVLPDPDAIMVTGITPQKTIAEGVTEAEFLEVFYKKVSQPDTIFAGFNNVRFDDEFMRYLNWRNFYDAYEWQWARGASRWDLLDAVRMTRALRPDGIEWPFAPDGKPTNRLEILAKINKLDHANAHDALSDVLATIDLARLVKQKQPELFDYLLGVRDKKKVAELVESNQPFVYTTGRYPSANLHTSAAVRLINHPERGALVYDLRQDPTPFLAMTVDEIVEAWRFTRDPDAVRLPVKTMKYNRCPAVAPLGVIKDKTTQNRIGLNLETIQKHFDILKTGHAEFTKKVLAAVDKLDQERQQTQASLVDNELTVDARLYDGFVDGADKRIMTDLRRAKPAELSEFASRFKDERLRSLLPIYKARNFPGELSEEERAEWDKFCQRQLFSGDKDSRLAKYMQRIEELLADNLKGEKQYLLEELRLYGESIVPSELV